MFVRALSAPASAAGHVWHDLAEIVEVADDLGHEIVHVAGGTCFAEVLPGDLPKPKKAKAD